MTPVCRHSLPAREESPPGYVDVVPSVPKLRGKGVAGILIISASVIVDCFVKSRTPRDSQIASPRVGVFKVSKQRVSRGMGWGVPL